MSSGEQANQDNLSGVSANKNRQKNRFDAAKGGSGKETLLTLLNKRRSEIRLRESGGYRSASLCTAGTEGCGPINTLRAGTSYAYSVLSSFSLSRTRYE
jgi:hypothetical protein